MTKKQFRADTGHYTIIILAESAQEAARIFEQGERPEKAYYSAMGALLNYQFKTPQFMKLLCQLLDAKSVGNRKGSGKSSHEFFLTLRV